MQHIRLILLLAIISLCNGEKSSTFRNLVNSAVFVDKTLLLKIFFDDLVSSVRQFIVCPPGFGKTTVLDMIELFSSVEFHYDSTIKIPNTTISFDVFNRTKIGTYRKFIDGNLARYIVLRLDADINPHYVKYTRSLVYDFVYDVLIKAIDKYSQILNEDRLTRSEKMFLQELHERRFDTEEITCLLGYLVKMLHDYFQIPVVLLVDNYDSPMKRSIFNADCNPHVDIFYDIFNEMIFYASKYPRNYLARLVIASTTSIPFNWYSNETQSFHLHEFSIKNAYDKFLGFVEPEMKEMITKLKLTPAERSELREFYVYPNIHPEYDIYNPRSIVGYLEYRQHIRLNRTLLHRKVYKHPSSDDFKFIVGSFQNTQFEQKLFLLCSNQSIRLPGIWIGDKLTLSVLKNTTDYKDFVNRAFLWIYMMECAYVTYSTDGIGFQAASQEIMYALRESLYENFDKTRIPFDKIGSTMMDFVRINNVLDSKSMLESVTQFKRYLTKAYQNINSDPEVHPREAIFASVVFVSSHVSVAIESSMIISSVEIRSNLTVSSARYNIYYQDICDRQKTAVVMEFKYDNGTMRNETLNRVLGFLPAQHRLVKYLTYMAVDVDSDKNVRIEYVTHDDKYIKNLSTKKKIS